MPAKKDSKAKAATKKAKPFILELDSQNKPQNGREGCEYRIMVTGMRPAHLARARMALEQDAKKVDFIGGRRVATVYELSPEAVKRRFDARVARQRAKFPAGKGHASGGV